MPGNFPCEPSIVINGRQLTTGEAMTVRVAIGSFMIQLQSDGLGDDAHGKMMTDAYMDRLREISTMMHAPAWKPPPPLQVVGEYVDEEGATVTVLK